MRIHTNVIGYTQTIRSALAEQIALGRIAPHVTFKTLAPHRSQTHMFAFEIQLEAAERDRGRRAGNSGSYGAMRPEQDGYAATFDEWGWLLAALYRLDLEMIVGSVKTPTYSSTVHFHRVTALTYNPEVWLDEVCEWPACADERDPFPIVTGKAVGTKAGYVVGRRGADRRTRQDVRSYWPHDERPRTVAEVLAFAWPNGDIPEAVRDTVRRVPGLTLPTPTHA